MGSQAVQRADCSPNRANNSNSSSILGDGRVRRVLIGRHGCRAWCFETQHPAGPLGGVSGGNRGEGNGSVPNQGGPGLPSAGDEGRGRKDDLPLPLGCHACPLRLCCLLPLLLLLLLLALAEGRLTRCGSQCCPGLGFRWREIMVRAVPCTRVPCPCSLSAALPGLSALPDPRCLNPPSKQTRPAPLTRALHFLPCPLFHFGEGCRSWEAARIMYIPGTASHLRARVAF